MENEPKKVRLELDPSEEAMAKLRAMCEGKDITPEELISLVLSEALGGKVEQ